MKGCTITSEMHSLGSMKPFSEGDWIPRALKGSCFHHPKKVTSRIARYLFFHVDCSLWILPLATHFWRRKRAQGDPCFLNFLGATKWALTNQFCECRGLNCPCHSTFKGVTRPVCKTHLFSAIYGGLIAP